MAEQNPKVSQPTNLGDEYILPFSMSVVGEEDEESSLSRHNSQLLINCLHHANKTLETWKVVPPLSPDATPKQSMLLVEWPTKRSEAVFHLFPKLPPELRLQIWEELLPEPRIIRLRLDTRPTNESLLQAWPPSSRQDHLLACFESRAVLKNHYRYIVCHKNQSEGSTSINFTSHYDFGTSTDSSPVAMWTPQLFSCHRDTLWVGRSEVEIIQASGFHVDMSLVRNIAFCTSSVYEMRQNIAKKYKDVWQQLFKVFPAMRALTMVHNTHQLHRLPPVNYTPNFLELNSEIGLLELEPNSRRIMENQARAASMARELFYEVYGDSIIFKVTRLCFEDLHERRYYEVIDLEPADPTKMEDTSYFTRRPIGPCYGKYLHVIFEDHSEAQECTAKGDLISPYDGIERLFREKSRQEIQDEDSEQDMNWVCYGGEIILY